MLHMHFSAEIIPCADTNQKVDNNTLLNFTSLVRSLSLIFGFSCNVCDVPVGNQGRKSLYSNIFAK